MTLCLTRRSDETRAWLPYPGVTAQFACYRRAKRAVTTESSVEPSMAPVSQPFNAVVEPSSGTGQ
jgi:hypothetical protein